MANEREPFPTDDELSAVAAALGSLAPAKSRLDRDRVMFRAGQASSAAARPADRGRRFWPAIAASFGLIAAGEAAWLAQRTGPTVVVIREPAPTPTAPGSTRDPGTTDPPPAVVLAGADPALGRTARERLVGQVLRYGLDGLPASPSARLTGPESSPSPSRRWLHEDLRKSLDHGDRS